jgi:hypothetical protein
VAGEFDYTFAFAKKNIERSGDWDVFVLRYRENGDMGGSEQVTGPGFKKATGLGIDKAGNLYLLGYFMKQAFFGDLVLKSAGPNGCGFISRMEHFSGM